MKIAFSILGKILICLVVLVIIAMIVFGCFVKANNKDYGNNEKRLKSYKSNTKKALVVYQPSRSKLTSTIANSIAKGINDQGYEVTINYPGKHMTTDLSDYSIVVFGSPVYIGQTSSTLTDYMKSIKDLSDKKILLFATGGQLNSGEVDKMEDQLGGIKATEKVGFKNGMKDKDNAYEVGKKLAEDNK